MEQGEAVEYFEATEEFFEYLYGTMARR